MSACYCSLEICCPAAAEVVIGSKIVGTGGAAHVGVYIKGGGCLWL